MAEPWLIRFFACNREMQPFSFCLVGYSLCVWGGISGWVRALNLTVPLGSGRFGSGWVRQSCLWAGFGLQFWARADLYPVYIVSVCSVFLCRIYCVTLLLPFWWSVCTVRFVYIKDPFYLYVEPSALSLSTQDRPTRMTAAEDALCGLRQGGL